MYIALVMSPEKLTWPRGKDALLSFCTSRFISYGRSFDLAITGMLRRALRSHSFFISGSSDSRLKKKTNKACAEREGGHIDAQPPVPSLVYPF